MYVTTYTYAHITGLYCHILNALFYMFECICVYRVNALAWDGVSETLYLGGIFNLLEDSPVSSGLAMWQADTGIVSFPGGGVTRTGLGVDGIVSALAFEPISKVCVCVYVYMYIYMYAITYS